MSITNQFFISGQKAARYLNTKDQEGYDAEKRWFKTAVAMAPMADKETFKIEYERGYSDSRRIVNGGFYL